MSRIHLFADETGDFAFARGNGASRYFGLVTVVMDNCDVGHSLVQLRRDLAWKGAPPGDYFHASTGRQEVPDSVFGEICKFPFTIQATLMEKSKAQPQVRVTRHRFYQYGWFYHFKHGASKAIGQPPELMIVTAPLGTKKERRSFEDAAKDVLHQTIPGLKHQANFCPAAADPCLSRGRLLRLGDSAKMGERPRGQKIICHD